MFSRISVLGRAVCAAAVVCLSLVSAASADTAVWTAFEVWNSPYPGFEHARVVGSWLTDEDNPWTDTAPPTGLSYYSVRAFTGVTEREDYTSAPGVGGGFLEFSAPYFAADEYSWSSLKAHLLRGQYSTSIKPSEMCRIQIWEANTGTVIAEENIPTAWYGGPGEYSVAKLERTLDIRIRNVHEYSTLLSGHPRFYAVAEQYNETYDRWDPLEGILHGTPAIEVTVVDPSDVRPGPDVEIQPNSSGIDVAWATPSGSQLTEFSEAIAAIPASSVGAKLSVHGNNPTTMEIENLSTGLQIESFSITIGDTSYDYDAVQPTEYSVGDLSFSLVTPDRLNLNVAGDVLEYTFDGFDAGEKFVIPHVDLDRDGGWTNVNFENVLFDVGGNSELDNALVTVVFSDGTVLGGYLPDYPLDPDGTYEFVLVPEPGTLGLLALGGLALIRRRKA